MRWCPLLRKLDLKIARQTIKFRIAVGFSDSGLFLFMELRRFRHRLLLHPPPLNPTPLRRLGNPLPACGAHTPRWLGGLGRLCLRPQLHLPRCQHCFSSRDSFLRAAALNRRRRLWLLTVTPPVARARRRYALSACASGLLTQGPPTGRTFLP